MMPILALILLALGGAGVPAAAAAPQAPAASRAVRPVRIVLGAPRARAQPDGATRIRTLPRSILDTAGGGEDLAPLAGPAAASGTGGQSNATSIGQLGERGGELSYYEVTMTITATGWQETFVVYTPTPVPTGPRPLLVVFHKFGSSQRDVLVNTTYVQEAASRGWFLVAPLSAHKLHFSSIEGQAHTEAVLDWMDATFPIDRQRIYAVGFSMGGGAVTSYAARHLDPARPMFAALVDHTGTVDLNDVYLNDPPARFIFDFWYGDGSAGSADPWRMARSSVLRFDDITLAVDDLWSLDRNLLHLPMRIVRASHDPIVYLPRQCDVLDDHLKAQGVQPGSRYGYYIFNSATHSWDLLDEKAACDWLSQHRLQLPTSGRTLADHDGTYFHFTVEQAQQGAFTPFAWSVTPATNTLALSETANLTSLRVDLAGAGLGSASELRVSLATADGIGDRIVLAGYDHRPSLVLRDGVPATSWSWSAARKELVLDEFDGAQHLWRVLP